MTTALPDSGRPSSASAMLPHPSSLLAPGSGMVRESLVARPVDTPRSPMSTGTLVERLILSGCPAIRAGHYAGG